MPVVIKEVTTPKDLKAFVRFPLSLYRNHPHYVPLLEADELNTLRQDKNPAFDHCEARYWLAYKDGQLAGRIAGIFNRLHLETWKQPYLRFGWLDFIDDLEVSAGLFKKVEEWAAELGLSALHGPLGFTDMDREAMLVEGFDQLGTLASIYNYPYYPGHMQQLGFVKDVDWVEFEVQVPDEALDKVAKMSELLQKRYNLHLADFKSKKELLKYVDQLFDLLNTAYLPLYGVVPLTRKQIDAYVKQYFGFINPDFVPVVLDENNRMIAFGITMPSLSHALQKARGQLFPFGFVHLLSALKWNKRADLYLVAVQPDYQGRGVNAILMNRMIEVFRKYGIRTAESNPELETNVLVQGHWKYFEHRQHKRRRVFIKGVGASGLAR